MSREWLTLLIRRMNAVAGIYRIAASLSPGTDALRSQVECHRRGRFDATTTPDQNKRSAGSQGPAVAAYAERLFDGPLPWAKLRQGHKLIPLSGGRRSEGGRGGQFSTFAVVVQHLPRHLELILRFAGTPDTDPGSSWIGLTRGQIPAYCWGWQGRMSRAERKRGESGAPVDRRGVLKTTTTA